MDPLSISAGAIAVGTLAVQVLNAFNDLRDLVGGLPGRLHALHNEVADLQLVLFQLSILVKERERLPDSQYSVIPHLLNQANGRLTELRVFVVKLTTTCRSARIPILGAHVWRKEQSKLLALQDGLRTNKANLNILLGASNSQDIMQIRLDVENISSLAIKSSEDQSAQSDHVITKLDGVDDHIAKVEDLIRTQAEQLKANQLTQFGSIYNRSQARRRRSPAKKVEANPIRSEGLGVRVTPYVVSCRTGCPCACHTQQKSNTPTLVNRVLGQLFVGYAGLPVLSPKCSIDACKKNRASQVSLEYWFPLAFVSSTIVRMQIGYQPNLGTLWQLDTLRRVPDTAQCVNFALNGDIEGLKYLFSNGLASPRDVSTTRGYSVLRWALYGKQYETCEFLMSVGADPDYKPISVNDNNPRYKACHFLLEGGLPKKADGALQALTRGTHLEEFIEEAQFTQIHRIVLGLSGADLEKELLNHPEDIDVVDAMSRTPLSWAAARGDARAIITLLKYGADPNILDVQVSGPVCNAASRGYSTCVRLLLEAGGLTDPPLPPGVKKGNALNTASRTDCDPMLLKNLLDFGAEVDSCGVDGKTALIYAAMKNNASFAMILLEYGADINAASTSGQTPLTTAITYNSHDVLRLILDRWHEYSSCPRLKGPHLLQIAALYADVETCNILSATDHFRLSYDKSYTLGDFSSRLKQRANLSEKLLFAFDELLDVIAAEPDEREDAESLLEAGYFSCLASRSNSDLGKNDDMYHHVHGRELKEYFFDAEDEDDEDGDDEDVAFHDAVEGLEGLSLGGGGCLGQALCA